jgi:hypothetical protein
LVVRVPDLFDLHVLLMDGALEPVDVVLRLHRLADGGRPVRRVCEASEAMD